MRKGIRLTPRDFHFLRDCYEKTVMSFSQLHRSHFPGLSKATHMNRLGRLKRAGYLRATRVGIVLAYRERQDIGSVYQVTRSAIPWLRSRFPEQRFRDRPVSFNSWTLPHDLLLGDVIDRLKGVIPGQLIHGRLLSSVDYPGTRTPDAVCVDPASGEKIAIELELTVKSALRYREILLSYGAPVPYSKVLYVVAQDSIAAAIRAQLGAKPVAGLPSKCTGKFYFESLKSLLDAPSNPIGWNGVAPLVIPPSALLIPKAEDKIDSDPAEKEVSV